MISSVSCVAGIHVKGGWEQDGSNNAFSSWRWTPSPSTRSLRTGSTSDCLRTRPLTSVVNPFYTCWMIMPTNEARRIPRTSRKARRGSAHRAVGPLHGPGGRQDRGVDMQGLLRTQAGERRGPDLCILLRSFRHVLHLGVPEAGLRDDGDGRRPRGRDRPRRHGEDEVYVPGAGRPGVDVGQLRPVSEQDGAVRCSPCDEGQQTGGRPAWRRDAVAVLPLPRVRGPVELDFRDRGQDDIVRPGRRGRAGATRAGVSACVRRGGGSLCWARPW